MVTPESELTVAGALRRLMDHVRSHKEFESERQCVLCVLPMSEPDTRPRAFCVWHGAEQALRNEGVDPGTPPMKINL